MLRLLADRDLLIEEQKKYKLYKGTMPKVDRDMAKAEMGAWLADYFDDAGYDNWESQCQLYKAMVMSAFPPIDPLDDKMVDADTADLEALMLGFLNVSLSLSDSFSL